MFHRTRFCHKYIFQQIHFVIQYTQHINTPTCIGTQVPSVLEDGTRMPKHVGVFMCCALYHEKHLLENILMVKLVYITILYVLLTYEMDDGLQYIHRPPER